MTPKRRIGFETEAAIRSCLLDNMSGPEIERRLKVMHERGELTEPPPLLRTIQRSIADIRNLDRSEPWRFGDSSVGEAAPVLEAIAAAILETEGRVTGFSRGEAAYIARLAATYPELPVHVRWRLARLYVLREGANEPTDDLDMLLAFAPWQPDSDERWARYSHATVSGWISRAPFVVVETLRTWQPVMHNEDLDKGQLEHWGRDVAYQAPLRVPRREMRDITDEAAATSDD